MPTYLSPFLPSVHGFRFGNEFRNLWALVIATWGRCNGMAQTALDYYFAGQPVPNIRVVDYGLRPLSGLAVSSWDANHHELYVVRDGDRVAGKKIESGTPQDWRTLFSTRVTGTPAAASWGPGRVDLVARGEDGYYRHQWRDGGGWLGEAPCFPSPWIDESLGGDPLASSPAISAPFPDRLEIYGRHADGTLRFLHYNAGWQPWWPLGRPSQVELVGDPAAASGYGWMMCVIQGSNRAYWVREWTHGGWQPWYSLGGAFTSSPALASAGPGQLDVYGRGDDGRIWRKVYGSAGWPASWDPVVGMPPPGASSAQPAAVAHPGQRIVFVIGNDRNVWQRTWNGGWQPWAIAENAITADSQRLTDAVYGRTFESTVNPIIAASASVFGLAFGGSAAKYVTLRPHTNTQLFHWAINDELTKIVHSLSVHRPVSLGLLDMSGGSGHEVVAWAVETNVSAPAIGHSTPGPYTFIHLYDPNYPGCNNITIKLDPTPAVPDNERITSSTGERWRALWARDDYRMAPPPV